jgi:hypothetical protein
VGTLLFDSGRRQRRPARAKFRSATLSTPRPRTFSRCVSSCSALYCATTLLTTSLPMDGSTRSSQSMPRPLKMVGSLSSAGLESRRRLMLTIWRSAGGAPRVVEGGGSV